MLYEREIWFLGVL